MLSPLNPMSYPLLVTDTQSQFAASPRGLRAEQRQRSSAINILVPLMAGVLSISTSAAEVTVRAVQPRVYELVLTNSTALSEGEARAEILKTASSICKDEGVVLGKWKYSSNEAVGVAASFPRTADSIRFVQEVTCVPGAKTMSGERPHILRSEDEAKQLESEIKIKSETYFKLIASRRQDEAVTYVSIARMGLNEAQWKSKKVKFQSMAGEPVQILIAKVTVYDNPAGAPEPGLYVAADYSNVYREVPVHCGYLMWFRPVGGEFRITREETGYITSEELKSIPNGQLPEIKRKFRCPAS